MARDRRSRDPLGRPRDPIAGDPFEVGRPTATVRIAARERGPAIATVLIGAFLAIAIAKPWVEQVAASRPAVVPSVAPTATPVPTPDRMATLRVHCQDPLGWRVYGHETWNGRDVRTWRSVEPATDATGPLDPTIPIVPFGPNVVGLGYCSPWRGADEAPEGAIVQAWQVREPFVRGEDAFSRIELHLVAPRPATPLGGLFGPLGKRGDPAQPDAVGWPAGRYVFAVHTQAWERWWSVDVAPPDAALRGTGSDGAPVTTPGATPAATPMPTSP